MHFSGEKKKRAVLSDSESDDGEKGASKRKKGTDSGSDTSDKPKKKSKKIVDSDDEGDGEKKDAEGGKCMVFCQLKIF